MKHLIHSFQAHKGTRGCHFYDEERCNFLSWTEVYKFLAALPERKPTDMFCEKLEETLANYNPDTQFLAVHQRGDAVSVELYTLS